MRVKSIDHDDDGMVRVWFEHNGVEWFKAQHENDFGGHEYMLNLLNSVINDTIARIR